MRTRLLLALVLVVPASAWAQDWCVDGKVDARRYFFQTIGRVEGQSAADWETVLRVSGLQAGPNPGVRPNRGVHQGISQQIGAAGSRGRLMLPTDAPDALGYYAREADILADANGGLCWQNPAFCVWTWKENQSQPPYAPNTCGLPNVPPPPTIPPPTPDPVPVPPPPVLTEKAILDAIERIHADLSAQHRTLGEKIDSPGWFEKVVKHPAFTALVGVMGGYLAKLGMD